MGVSDPFITFTFKHSGATTTVDSILVALYTAEVVVGSKIIALPVTKYTIYIYIYTDNVLNSGDLELSDSLASFALTLHTDVIIVPSSTIVIPVPTALLDSTTASQVFATDLHDHSDIIVNEAAGLFTLKSNGSIIKIAGTPVPLPTGDMIVGSSIFRTPSGLRISCDDGEAGSKRANAIVVVPFTGRARGSDIPWPRLLTTTLGTSLITVIVARDLFALGSFSHIRSLFRVPEISHI